MRRSREGRVTSCAIHTNFRVTSAVALIVKSNVLSGTLKGKSRSLDSFYNPFPDQFSRLDALRVSNFRHGLYFTSL